MCEKILLKTADSLSWLSSSSPFPTMFSKGSSLTHQELELHGKSLTFYIKSQLNIFETTVEQEDHDGPISLT